MSFCPLNQVGFTRCALGCLPPVVHPPAPPDAPPRGTLTAGSTPARKPSQAALWRLARRLRESDSAAAGKEKARQALKLDGFSAVPTKSEATTAFAGALGLTFGG